MDWFLTAITMYLLAASSPTHATTNTTHGFRIPVIHSRSRLSPFYNVTTTLDKSRILRAQGNYSISIEEMTVGRYVVPFRIGSLLTEMHLLADTGSSLTWLQCQPCSDCDNLQYVQPYDTFTSETFKTVACEASFCTGKNSMGCKDGDCEFEIEYLDHSRARGIVATELFSFRKAGGFSRSYLRDFRFGCARHDRRPNNISFENGIFGLGRGEMSILSQFSIMKFSHCLPPPLFDGFQFIEFGSHAKLLGQRARLLPTETGQYAIELNSVSFVSKVNEDKFGDSEKRLSMIIDTGTTLTYVQPMIFYELFRAIDNAFHLGQYDSRGDNCYRATLADVAGAEVTFHFTGFNVKISKMLFYEDGEYVCLGIGSENDFILGANSLMNYNVAYDLENMEVWFKEADCSIPHDEL